MKWSMDLETEGRTDARVAEFSSFSIQKRGKGVLFGLEAMNCDLRNGTLKGGVGVLPYLNALGNEDTFVLDVEPIRVFPVVYNLGAGTEDEKQLCFVGADGYLYWRKNASECVKKNYMGTTDVTHLCLRGEDRRVYNVFVNSMRVVCATEKDEFSEVLRGNFFGACTCGGRLFVAATSGRILYSAPYKPDRWSGGAHDGGELHLATDGEEVVSIASSDGYVYAFTSRHVYRWRVSANALDFQVESVSYAGEEICRGSAVATGEGVLFFAGDGAYFARGLKTEKVCRHLDIRPHNVREVCFVGRCEDLVLIKYRQADGTRFGKIQRVALTADGRDGFFTEDSSLLSGNYLTMRDGAVYRFAASSSQTEYREACHFASAPTDLGTRKRKTLRRVRLRGSGSVTMTVASHGQSHRYAVQFVDGEAEMLLLESGRAFVFSFELPLQGDARVESLFVDYFCLS